MDKTEFYPAEVRIPLEEPQLSHLLPARRFSVVQMIGTRPVGFEWETQQKMDAELFPEFEKKIFDIEDGVAELQATGELTNTRVFGMLQHQLFDDLVLRVDTTKENAGLSQAEIRVLDYLDVVLPISPDDEVVDNVAEDENPRPSWFDYVTQQAEKIQDEMIDGEIQADNLVVPPEVRVRAMREGRIARGREYLKNSAIIAGLGVTALVGGEVVGSVVNADSVENATQFISGALGGWAVLRGLNWILASVGGAQYEREFAERLQYPIFESSQLKKNITLLAAEDYKADDAPRDLSRPAREKYNAEKSARNYVLDILDLINSDPSSTYPFIALADRLDVYDESQDYDAAVKREIYRLLDKYLPITGKDTVTPVNELTGEKTWRGFFEDYLTENKQKQ